VYKDTREFKVGQQVVVMDATPQGAEGVVTRVFEKRIGTGNIEVMINDGICKGQKILFWQQELEFLP